MATKLALRTDKFSNWVAAAQDTNNTNRNILEGEPVIEEWYYKDGNKTYTTYKLRFGTDDASFFYSEIDGYLPEFVVGVISTTHDANYKTIGAVLDLMEFDCGDLDIGYPILVGEV